ncbi:hypothetical protein K2X14_17240 [Acetobacter sp. TBRC 12305]|uniref:Uncharacterized protein n=1 Tax=Acetobacter garciniae TaxID=2817435 RepID=A0A939HLV2_9PROT|nr:hypothetical protein [Acetobacter garciniae]MBO1326840.1 hypothetical protein [Acetobacter garciniae]MBX0346565.1 hypothetical protein [Acetobacter garciniae]
MLDERCAAEGGAAEDDLRAVVDGHSQEIAQINGRLDGLEKGQDGLMREVVAIRAEGQARAQAAGTAMTDLRNGLYDLTRQLAEHTGAQKRQAEIAQQALVVAQTREARIKYWGGVCAIVFCVAGAVGGTLFSSATVDDYVFGDVRWLHRHHLVDTGGGNADAPAH